MKSVASASCRFLAANSGNKLPIARRPQRDIRFCRTPEEVAYQSLLRPTLVLDR